MASGKLQRKLIAGGVVAAGVGAILTPHVNNAVEGFLNKDAVFLGDVLGEEMTDAANGQGFDTSRFTAEKKNYTDFDDAVGDVKWDAGVIFDKRVTAAATCGLLAVNGVSIPAEALKKWKAANAESNTSAASDIYKAAGDLCLDAFPPINGEDVPASKKVEQTLVVINGLVE